MENKILKLKDLIIRFTVVLSGLIFWLVYRFYFLSEKKKSWHFEYCFKDKITLDLLGDITRYLSQNWNLRNLLMISASNFLDIFFVSFLCVFVNKGNSWKPILHLVMFYGVRNALVQSMILLEFYDTYIFGDPEFPTILVPFVRAPDFFYSGHAGCAIIIGMQLRDMGYKEMMYVGVLMSFYEGFVLTVTRGHYSMDIVFGMMMAHYIYFYSTKLGDYLDNYVPVWGVPTKNELTEEEAKTYDVKAVETNTIPDSERGYNNVYSVTQRTSITE